MPGTILADLRRRLRAVADPARAEWMRAYMKSTMAFHGVPTPARRIIVRGLWPEHAPADAATWRTQVAGLWDGATRREERYAAVDWCAIARAGGRLVGRAAGAFHDPDALPLLRRLIRAGAWWDLVDDLAAHDLGMLLRRFPAEIAPEMRRWARSDDRWLRRAAVIAQLDAKAATDTILLADCIAPSLEPSPFAREFFVAKGIGWALRQHARSDPAWVRRYLREQGARLPALSRREAAKRLG